MLRLCQSLGAVRLSRFLPKDGLAQDIKSSDSVWAIEVDLLPGVQEKDQEFCAVHLRKGRKGGAFEPFAPPRVFAVQWEVTTFADVRSRVMKFADSIGRHLGNSALEASLTTTTGSTLSDEGTALPGDGAFCLEPGQMLCLDFYNLDASGALPRPVVKGSTGAELSTPLEACLDSYQRCEALGQDDWVHCKKTSKVERTLKELALWSVPEVLIVHLKRFGRKSLRGPLDKISTFVRCPVRLDLAPWVMGPKPEGGSKYALYATVNHSGSLAAGHYTAFARVGEGSDRQWCYFNDASVSLSEEGRVVSKATYILFYERVKEPSSSPPPAGAAGRPETSTNGHA